MARTTRTVRLQPASCSNSATLFVHFTENFQSSWQRCFAICGLDLTNTPHQGSTTVTNRSPRSTIIRLSTNFTCFFDLLRKALRYLQVLVRFLPQSRRGWSWSSDHQCILSCERYTRSPVQPTWSFLLGPPLASRQDNRPLKRDETKHAQNVDPSFKETSLL